MAKIRFKTNVPNHTRELSAKDLHELGVEDAKKLSLSTGEVKEVADTLADTLIEKLPGEFEIVEDDAEDEETEPATNLSDTEPEGKKVKNPGGGGSQTGANTRDGAGARSTSINR